jgi:TIR domain
LWRQPALTFGSTGGAEVLAAPLRTQRAGPTVQLYTNSVSGGDHRSTPGYDGRMADVFISFADYDRTVALALKRVIEVNIKECKVFVTADSWQVTAGERWLDRIETELRSAKIVVVILSGRSLNRPWVNFEAGAAWLNRARLIPACIGGLASRDLPKPYSDFQAVHLERDGDVNLLIRSVSEGLGNDLPPMPVSAFDASLKELHDALRSVEESLSATVERDRGLESIDQSRAAQLPASGRVSFDEATVSMLSERARLFLREAAKTDTGQINRSDLDQALVIQVNNQAFEAGQNNGRLRAEFEDALTELEENGLVDDVIRGSRSLFQLTSKGYRIAQRLEG